MPPRTLCCASRSSSRRSITFIFAIRHIDAGKRLGPLSLQRLLLELADDPVQAGASGPAHRASVTGRPGGSPAAAPAARLSGVSAASSARLVSKSISAWRSSSRPSEQVDLTLSRLPLRLHAEPVGLAVLLLGDVDPLLEPADLHLLGLDSCPRAETHRLGLLPAGFGQGLGLGSGLEAPLDGDGITGSNQQEKAVEAAGAATCLACAWPSADSGPQHPRSDQEKHQRPSWTCVPHEESRPVRKRNSLEVSVRGTASFKPDPLGRSGQAD